MKEEFNVLNLIRKLKNNNSLTNTQEKIADYILDNPGRTTVMSAQELSERVNSSPSSINRFVKDEFDLSYKEFKEILKDNITEESDEDSPFYETHVSFLSLIKKYLDENKFTKTQKKIAEYILNNVEKASSSTVEKLAKELNISGSNFIKFANELGLDGFKALQDNIKKDTESSIPINLITGKMTKEKRQEFFDKINKEASQNRESMYWLMDYQLFDENLEYNFKNYHAKNPSTSKFFSLIDNASNIIIYDYEDITRHVLHKNLNRYGYINYFTTSEIECLNQIDNIIENSEVKKKRTIKVLKNHTDPDLANYFSKNIEGNDNLLIIHSTFNHDESVNRILQKAQDKNLSIILVESNTTKDKIGSIDNIDLRINIGKTIAINDDKDHRAIINDIMFYELLNSQIRTYMKDKELSEKYNVDELFNEDGY
ncbi:MAG: MurR/RpiR family transcriptional regulator [Candidatus Woesearchaeota archaeon]